VKRAPVAIVGSSQPGFTLFELVIVLFIILCLMALLVPHVGIVVSKARTVRAISDCKRVGDAMLTWVIVHGGAPTPTVVGDAVDVGRYTPIDVDTLRSLLVPDYLVRVPDLDPWGHPYQYFLDERDPTGSDVALCASGGSDGSLVSGAYTIGATDPADSTEDIVWADGNFIRWPQ